MKKKIMFLSLLAGFCAAFMGCSEDDKEAAVPVYGELSVSDNIYTGQYAEAKVSYQTPGAYVLHADCKYTISSGGKNYSNGAWRIVDPKDNEPTFKFQAPYKEGNYDMGFSAKFSFYVDLPHGGIYGQSNSVSKRFKVLPADAVNACWGDTRDRLAAVLDVKDTTTVNGGQQKVYTGTLFFNTDTLKIAGERLYHFAPDGGFDKMEESAQHPLVYVTTSKVEVRPGEYVEINDSIANHKAYPYLYDLSSEDNWYSYGYAREGSPVLEGAAKDIYPVGDWEKNMTEKKAANIINAFWNGSLERYEQSWISDKTRCTVSVYAEGNKLYFKRNFLPLI